MCAASPHGFKKCQRLGDAPLTLGDAPLTLGDASLTPGDKAYLFNHFPAVGRKISNRGAAAFLNS